MWHPGGIRRWGCLSCCSDCVPWCLCMGVAPQIVYYNTYAWVSVPGIPGVPGVVHNMMPWCLCVYHLQSGKLRRAQCSPVTTCLVATWLWLTLKIISPERNSHCRLMFQQKWTPFRIPFDSRSPFASCRWQSFHNQWVSSHPHLQVRCSSYSAFQFIASKKWQTWSGQVTEWPQARNSSSSSLFPNLITPPFLL